MGGNTSISTSSYFSKCEGEKDLVEFSKIAGMKPVEEIEGEFKRRRKQKKWYFSGVSTADVDDDLSAFEKSMKKSKKKEKEELECAICYDDEDKSKFCELKCKHQFHKKCILEWMKGIPGKGDLFSTNHARCPMCRSWISAKKDKDINKLVNPIHQKWKETMKILMEADIDAQHKELLKKRKNEKDAFFDFMKNYQFFLCFGCEKIYFGGMRDCAAQFAQEEEEEGESIDPDAMEKKLEAEKKDHLCVKCKVKGSKKNWPTNCKAHGDAFIVFKCRYCCNIANWFCFGTTHFCERCHSLYPNMKVHKCKGLPECDSNHLPNGKEQCLGCVLCRK